MTYVNSNKVYDCYNLIFLGVSLWFTGSVNLKRGCFFYCMYPTLFSLLKLFNRIVHCALCIHQNGSGWLKCRPSVDLLQDRRNSLTLFCWSKLGYWHCNWVKLTLNPTINFLLFKTLNPVLYLHNIHGMILFFIVLLKPSKKEEYWDFTLDLQTITLG